MLVSGYLSG